MVVDLHLWVVELVARPDLNGKVGEAREFSFASGRYTVCVDGEQLALRPTNIQIEKRAEGESTTFAPDTRVRIKGLTAKPEVGGMPSPFCVLQMC